MTEDRGRRIGLNEALFRQVNERISELGDDFHMKELEILCECGDIDCGDRFEIEHQAYEELRSEPTHFAVLPGHEIPDVETVVERRRVYTVVRKDPGGPAEVAEKTDPRAGSGPS